MKWSGLLVIVLLFLGNLPSFGQQDSLLIHADLYFLTANQSFQPHWQVSNRYGIFDRTKQTEAVGLVGIQYLHRFGKKFRFETQAEFNVKSTLSESYIQQLYFNLFYGSIQLKIGKEAYTIGQYSDDLSAGSLFVSNNAQPVPRIGIGFYDYSPVPFIDDYLEFKGAVNFGLLDDDRSDYRGVDQPWYHEKFFYLRSKTLPVNIHVGLNHSALFGGTQSNGNSIDADLFATFFGRSSGRVGGGEAVNVAGAHFGMYDFGVNWEIKKTKKTPNKL